MSELRNEMMKRILSGKIVQAPTACYKAEADGKVGKELLDFYAPRAANPVIDIIYVEHSYVAPRGQASPGQISLATPDVVEGLSRLADLIHEGGKIAFIQLAHAGGTAKRSCTRLVPWSPSSMIIGEAAVGLGDPIPTQEMSKADIAQTVQQFADAAVRAVQAGFDGVEIHAAHAYLLNEFFSPLTNHRSDEYGGSIENRIRIHCEVAHAVRTAVGPDVPISMRFGGCDYTEGGNTIEDAVEAARIIAAKTDIDILNVSGGMCYYKRPGHKEPGYFKEMTTAVKQAVDLPVIVTGGVRTMADADALIAEGAGDLVGVSRAIFKNPHWPEEAPAE
jgi:2,4-dienoyl-CoA reductase-like NADH-dependent reductase (Old Yellow Enzyme family)